MYIYIYVHYICMHIPDTLCIYIYILHIYSLYIHIYVHTILEAALNHPKTGCSLRISYGRYRHFKRGARRFLWGLKVFVASGFRASGIVCGLRQVPVQAPFRTVECNENGRCFSESPDPEP